MYDEAMSLIRTTFKRAKDAVDMASSFILQSRVFAIRGDSFGAFQALKDCLSLLGSPLPPTSWEACDAEFQELCTLLQSMDKEELLARPALTNDQILTTLGPLFVELLSAAFWSNALLFYQATLKLVGLHLKHGTMSQASLGYVHLGAIAAGRFNMVEFAIECGGLAKAIFTRFEEDHYSFGRAQTLYTLFISHFQGHVSTQIPELHGKFFLLRPFSHH